MGLFWIGRVFLALSIALMLRISSSSSALDQVSNELQALKNQSTIDQLQIQNMNSGDFQTSSLEPSSKEATKSDNDIGETKQSRRDVLYDKVKAKTSKKNSEVQQLGFES